MQSLREAEDQQYVRKWTRTLANMPQAEYLVLTQLTSEELQKRSDASRKRMESNQPRSIDTFLDTYSASLGDGSRQFEGLATGMPTIDHLIGGLNRFVLLAARAGAGKSTLAIQMALGAHTAEGVPVIYYSFEMKRDNVITMILQTFRAAHEYKLTRNEIVLNGNSPISSASALAITESTTALKELGGSFYIIDSSDGDPSLERIETDIAFVMSKHGGVAPLVIIDSIQDLVKPDTNGVTQAEAVAVQKIVEIQQNTNATFLTISQKAKGASIDDGYSSVLGSVSLIHKPTTVIELIGVYDLLKAVKDQSRLSIYRKLADNSSVPNPVVLNVIKGRNNGYGRIPLKHYGKYSYFETGRIADFNTEEGNLYNLNGIQDLKDLG